MAKEAGFIQRKRKITARDFVNTLVFSGEDHGRLSLLDLSCDYSEATGTVVSREALHKHFTPEAVGFLKAVFARQLSFQMDGEKGKLPGCGFFTGIHIKDSTKFTLPASFIDDYPGYGSFNKQSALMNFQYEFDLMSMACKSMELTRATRNDQEDSKQTLEGIQSGSLNIRDRGYITTTYLKGVGEKQAYYLNRLPKIGIYLPRREGGFRALDWKELDLKMKKTGMGHLEIEVYLGRKEKLKTRMVIVPVPKEVAGERIRKAELSGKRTKGYQLSKEYRIQAHYNIFITNVPEEVLSTEQVISAYTLRWQVELIFKTWKSNLDIHKTKPMKKERMECQILAKLMWILLNTSLLSVANNLLKGQVCHKRCSYPKFFKRARRFSPDLKNKILCPRSFTDWFSDSLVPIIPKLTVEKRLDQKPHDQIFYELFCA